MTFFTVEIAAFEAECIEQANADALADNVAMSTMSDEEWYALWSCDDSSPW